MNSPYQVFDDAGEAARYAEYRIRQTHEYGMWVAATNIYVGGALAFIPGHPVPASTVATHGWDQQGLVVPADTPPPDPQQVLAAQRRERLAQLDAERAALAAELGDDTPPASSESDTPVEVPGVEPDPAGRRSKTKE